MTDAGSRVGEARRALRGGALLAGAVSVVLVAAGASGAPARGPAARAPVVAGNVRISGPGATGSEWTPVAACRVTVDECLVAWSDDRAFAERNWDIYGRLVTASGEPLTAEFPISGPGAVADEWDPAVVWNEEAEEYLVVWQDGRRTATRGYDIYGQRISHGGTRVEGDFRISAFAARADEWAPAVAWNAGDNQYLVVWEDRRHSTSGDVYGQRLSATGVPLGKGQNFPVSSAAATAGEVSPAVAWNWTAGEYLVVWQDARHESTSGNDIYARRVTADGGRPDSDVRLSGPAAIGHDEEPAVACAPAANGCLVVWADGRHRWAYPWTSDIYGQRVSDAGRRLGGNFRISGPAATADDQAPAAAWDDAAGVYRVVWSDARDAAGRGWDVYGQSVSLDGARLGANFRVSGPGALGMEVSGAAAFGAASGQTLVVWQDGRNLAERGWDVFAAGVTG